MVERVESDYQVLQDTRRAELRAEVKPILAGRTRLTLEIGSGHGHFLSAYAAAHPESFCVGIDIMSDRVKRGLRKRDRAKLGNLSFVHADAGDFLSILPDDVKLDAVFVLFPDPWPKRRHWKNRLIQNSFLNTLAEKTTSAAPLYFRTDYATYFEEAEAVIRDHPSWKINRDALWPFEHTTVFQARAPAYQSLIAFRSP